MHIRFLRFAVPLVLVGLVATACGNDNNNAAASGATGSTGAACNEDIKVGMALDVGGLGDQSFNDAANRGLQNAIKDGLVCEENTKLVPANESSYLVGIAAAMQAQKDGSNTVGFLGGQTGPLIGSFEGGYEAGVASVDPGIKVLVEYIGDSTQAFVNPTAGKALSEKMY